MLPINQPISVLALTTPKHPTQPYGFTWKSRLYKITQIGYHYTTKQGQELIHIFTGTTDTLAFKIAFHTHHLTWTLLEIAEADKLSSQTGNE